MQIANRFGLTMLHPWFDPSHDEFSNPMRDARTDLLADSQPDLQADSPAGSQKDVRLNALMRWPIRSAAACFLPRS
ncbi:MAG: hypothetical protein IPP59_01420 [Betaproteobacteria bacterium]|nr:hypothetical protein [Candidatus Dechloromonas phosphorivorans]